MNTVNLLIRWHESREMAKEAQERYSENPTRENLVELQRALRERDLVEREVDAGCVR